METNGERTNSGPGKNKGPAQKPSRVKKPRRDVLKAIVAGTAAGALGALPGGTAEGKASSQNQLNKYTLDAPKVQHIAENPEACAEYVAAVEEVVKAMVADPKFGSAVLEGVDSVLLINLFNENRLALESVVGRIDGRTLKGRYRKILYASELFQNVSGFDRVGYKAGAEEAIVFSGGAQSSATPASSSSSSSCAPGTSSSYGCCVFHYWGWICGGSCSPCAARSCCEGESPRDQENRMDT